MPASRLFKTSLVMLAGSMLLAGSIATAAQSDALDDSLKNWLDLPQQQLVQKLEEFRGAAFQSQKQKERAAYVLARTMQKTLPPKSSSTDSDAAAQAKKVIDLYEEASHVDGLWTRSQNHIVEVATAAQLEPELRTHLEQLKGKAKDAAAKNAFNYSIAQSYYRSKDFEKAKPLFLKLQAEAAGSQPAIGSNYYLGKIDIADAQAAAQGGAGGGGGADGSGASGTGAPTAGPLTDNAVTYFRNYLAGAPDGRSAREIVDLLLSAANAASARTGMAAAIPPADRELFAEVYYDTGNYSGALEQWALENSPKHLLQKASCLAHLGRSREAQAMLLQAVAQHDTSSHTTYDAIATILTNPMSRADTLAFYKQILAAHPAKADAALWNIATRTPLPEAIPLFQKILASYPTSEFAPESVWWLVWAQAKAPHQTPAKLAAAVSLAHSGMTKYPGAKAASKLAFWAGKMDELLHQPEAAKTDYEWAAKNFPSYYYGLRAGARLAVLNAAKKGPDRGWSTKPDRQIKATWSWPDYQQMTPDDQMAKTYGKAAAQLISLQQIDEAVDELPPGVDPVFKAALRASDNDYAGAIRAAGKTLEGRPSGDQRWQMDYPRMYCSDVMAGAQANHLDPLLIHALIREESRYNPMALSRSKAIGLTQLMPGTAYGVAKRLGVPLSGLSEVYKPEINIKLGSNYLSSVLQRAGNNAMLAVASYNGGPNAVQTWLGQHNAAGYPDFDYFVENIPFRETRDYVRKVFGSYWVYEKVYAEDK